MRVLVNDYAGHPFQLQLSEEFLRRGHEVVHQYCSNNVTPHADFENTPVLTRPIDTGGVFEKYRIHLRIRDELRYGLFSALDLHRQRPDVVLASNVPVLSLVALWVAARLHGTRRVLWLQDVQSGLAAQKLDSIAVRLPLWLFSKIEWATIRGADHVVTISRPFTDLVTTLRSNSNSVTEIENWAVLDAIAVGPRDNAFRAGLDLQNDFLFVYSGTLGIKHRPAILEQLARLGHDRCDVLVVSEGVAADALRAFGLPNLHVVPFRSFSKLGETLAAADALIVLLEPAVEGFSVPSKLLTYLCAGRTIIAAAPLTNAASQIIIHRAKCGFALPDADEFLARALLLIDERVEVVHAGRRARSFAEKTFDIKAVAARFEEVLR